MAKTILAVTTLLGTIIGAGIFGIPYAIAKSGIIMGLIHIITIAAITAIVFLYLGEISLRTKGDHHLSGYAEKYLGKKGKMIMLLSTICGIYAAILAYLIGVGNSLSFLLFNNQNYSLQLGITFWIIISILSLRGLKALKEGEFIGASTVIIIIISMLFFFINKINFNNLTQLSNPTLLNYFSPFGVILFAFLGYSIIPEIKKVLANNRKEMKRSIILTIVITTIIYITFTFIVIGISGKNTPKIATISLGKPFILLGIITMFNAYFALSVALIDALSFDFNQSKIKSWLYTTIIPIMLFIILTLTNSADFTKVIGIGGVISGGLTSILILVMINKAKILGDRHPEYSIPTSKILKFILITIFILGTTMEILNFFI